jgi:uncharacterized membrane protein
MAELDPRPRRSTGLLLIGVVFVLGMVCGASLFYLGQASVRRDGPGPLDGPPPPRAGRPNVGAPAGEQSMMRMFGELDLTPEQRERIQHIMRHSRGEVREVVERSREEIRALLDDGQREAFDRMRSDMMAPRGRRPPGFRQGEPPRRRRAEPPPSGPDDGGS